MDKKRLIALVAVVTTMFAGVGNTAESQTIIKGDVKVGMVTDSNNIDDKSFNQGTWEGIERAAKDFNLDSKYLKSLSETEDEYTKAIDRLVDLGFNFIVTPGFEFQTSIFKAQEKYKDIKFVLLDGSPVEGGIAGEKVKVGDNTVSILFAEHEAGFIAGVATALKMKDGDVGFIGGMETPPVQRFNWGFQQGIKYANSNLGTNIELKSENIIYQGSFTNVAEGQQLAAEMYDRGVKAIFCAAGNLCNGAINEAKERASLGKEAWIVGADKDQYDSGIYKGKQSVVITSAIKNLDSVTYNMIKDATEEKFQGGKILIYDVKNDGVGIPKKNPNLTEDTMKKVDEIYGKIKSGDIKVSAEKGDLIK